MYQAFNHFLLRTPLFPFDLFERVSRGKEEFMEILKNKYFREAVFIASPTLYKELLKYLEGKLTDTKEQERLLNSLERYFSRMSTRCTPFGLFATCSYGKTGNITNIRLEEKIQKETRLDMYYLCTLSQYLSQIPKVRQKIKYYPNTSLYSTGKKYRYIENKYIGERRIDRISAIQQSCYVDTILKKSYKGATIDELKSVIQNNEISEENALDFINEVIDSQIIVGELSPSVTGEDMLTKMIRILDSLDFQNLTILLVKEIQSLLKKLDKEIENPFNIYQNIIDKISLLKIPYKEDLLFQTDTNRKVEEAVLGHNVIEELQSAMQFLNRITPYREIPTLTRFRQLFYDRYENQELPLAEVLDPEMGIGYPPESNTGDFSPLLEHFFIPAKREPSTYSLPIGSFQSILLKKTVDVLSRHGREIILVEEDIKNFSQADWNNLPPTMFCMFALLKNDSNSAMLKLSTFSGSCGANLLARFSHTDEKIGQFVEKITNKEQDLMPEVILAEIVHLPESRVGNILSRPHLRRYELLYLSNSDLPQEQLIDISDWESFISIRSLFSIIKNRGIVKFTEFLFEPKDIVVMGKDGKYLNECIVAFHKN